MKPIVIFLCGVMALLLLAGCSGSSKSTTYTEKSFIGTWTGSDTTTHTQVTVHITADPVNNGLTTATVDIAVQNTNAPNGVFSTSSPISLPREVFDSTGEYNYYTTAYRPTGANYTFTLLSVYPDATTGIVNCQFTVATDDGTTSVGPVHLTLNRVSST